MGTPLAEATPATAPMADATARQIWNVQRVAAISLADLEGVARPAAGDPPAPTEVAPRGQAFPRPFEGIPTPSPRCCLCQEHVRLAELRDAADRTELLTASATHDFDQLHLELAVGHSWVEQETGWIGALTRDGRELAHSRHTGLLPCVVCACWSAGAREPSSGCDRNDFQRLRLVGWPRLTSIPAPGLLRRGNTIYGFHSRAALLEFSSAPDRCAARCGGRGRPGWSLRLAAVPL